MSFKIPYQIIIPKRALFLLSNIYHVKKEELLVLKKVESTLEKFLEAPQNRTTEEYAQYLKDIGEKIFLKTSLNFIDSMNQKDKEK